MSLPVSETEGHKSRLSMNGIVTDLLHIAKEVASVPVERSFTGLEVVPRILLGQSTGRELWVGTKNVNAAKK
jgi:hypothetical protein